jgi:hypothetical protein
VACANKNTATVDGKTALDLVAFTYLRRVDGVGLVVAAFFQLGRERRPVAAPFKVLDSLRENGGIQHALGWTPVVSLHYALYLLLGGWHELCALVKLFDLLFRA